MRTAQHNQLCIYMHIYIYIYIIYVYIVYIPGTESCMRTAQRVVGDDGPSGTPAPLGLADLQDTMASLFRVQRSGFRVWG